MSARVEYLFQTSVPVQEGALPRHDGHCGHYCFSVLGRDVAAPGRVGEAGILT